MEKKECSWCEKISYVKEDEIVCPNCNKEGYKEVDKKKSQ